MWDRYRNWIYAWETRLNGRDTNRVPMKRNFSLMTLGLIAILIASLESAQARKTRASVMSLGITQAGKAPAGLVAELPPHGIAARAADLVASPGIVQENTKDGLKYVQIPAGTFTMGCSPGDQECQPDEQPAHRVTITKAFWIGQTQVTVGAYKRFAAAKQEILTAPAFNPDWANENMPIVSVTWDEARDYCEWAGGRLPTEAEWEYAARGGSGQARYGSLAEIASDSPYGSLPRVVAQKRPNGFGLFDVLGNASEWVNDWYDEKYYQHSPSTDPPGPKGDGSKVLRGGPLTATPWIVRVSYRDRKDPGGRDFYDSFRCVWKAAGKSVDTPRE